MSILPVVDRGRPGKWAAVFFGRYAGQARINAQD